MLKKILFGVIIGEILIFASSVKSEDENKVFSHKPNKKIVTKTISENKTIYKSNSKNTLAGEDRNNNGVRDDIDKYIDEHYTNIKEHRAVIQSAKVLQKAILANKDNMNEIRKIDIEDNRAVHCLFQVFKPNKIPNEIESLTTNTKERLLEYLKYNKALDGTVSSEPEGDTCE